MFRRKLRRFDPRFGVSEQMVEAECVYVSQELRDCLLASVSDLRKLLKDRQTKIVTAEANLQVMIRHLPDRERLAIRSMLARDFYHIAALYEKLLKTPQVEGATAPSKPFREEHTEADEPLPVVPFSEWLFQG